LDRQRHTRRGRAIAARGVRHGAGARFHPRLRAPTLRAQRAPPTAGAASRANAGRVAGALATPARSRDGRGRSLAVQTALHISDGGGRHFDALLSANTIESSAVEEAYGEAE